MKKRKIVKLLILLAILLVLMILYVLLKKENAENNEESVETAVEIFGINDSDIKSLSFMIESQEVMFEKTDQEWGLSEDKDFPVNEEQIKVLTDALMSITANRTLNNVDNLSEYGLDKPTDVIKVVDQNDKETSIVIGDTNQSTGDCYIYLNESDSTVYTVDGDLSTVFSGSLMNYAQGEEFPTLDADKIHKIEIHSQGKSFVMESDESVVSGWKAADETGEIVEADITKASEIKSMISGLSYTNYYSYHCLDYSEYGIDEPFGVIRVEYEDEESDKSMILSIGNEDGNGNRYTCVEGSKEIHAVSVDSIHQLFELNLDDVENLFVSNIELTSLEQLDVTYQGKTNQFTFKEKNTVYSYYMNGREIDTLTFSSFYNKVIGIAAQKITDSEPEGEPELILTFKQIDNKEKIVSYYQYDTNYYLAVCDKKNYLINKMDFRDVIQAYEEIE